MLVINPLHWQQVQAVKRACLEITNHQTTPPLASRAPTVHSPILRLQQLACAAHPTHLHLLEARIFATVLAIWGILMPPADFAFSVQPVSTRTSAALLPVRYALLEPTPTVQRASSHAATAPLALGLLPAVILVARAYAWLDSLVRMVGHALLAALEATTP